MRLNIVDVVAFILVIVGGINWGLVGLFDYNLVESLFGANSSLSRSIYVLVGLAAVYMLYPLFKGLANRQDKIRLG